MNASTWYFESKLSEKLGISRDELVAIRRQLLQKKQEHWKMLGRELVISRAGVDLLLASLIEKTGAGIDLSKILSCAVPQQSTTSKAAPPPQKNGEVELTVKRLYPNDRLLLATHPETQEQLRVSVPSNANFRPAMKLKARPQGDPRQPWKLVGRCPRFPGRW